MTAVPDPAGEDRTALGRGRYRFGGSVLTHPARGDAGARVAAQGPPGLLRVVVDPWPDGPPTALRTAIAAWASVPAGHTHHLVLQDDMRLADGIWDRVLDAIEAAPDAALALFANGDSRNGAMVRIGALQGDRWVPAVGEYTPCAALVLPREIALGYARAADDQRADGWPDDILMQRFLRTAGVRCLIAVPNLAEHEDGPSIAGNAFRGPRRSACFLPVAPPGPPRIMPEPPWLVPFLKNGVAQCLERAADGTWLHLETEARLRLRGAPPAHGLTPEEHGVWLTAHALGLLSRSAPSRPGTPSGPGPAVPGPFSHPAPSATEDAAGIDAAGMDAAAAEALRTIGPGGVSQRPGAPLGADDLRRLADLAVRAVGAGRTGPLRPPAPSRAVVLRHDGDSRTAHLPAHLAAFLAEDGIAVTFAEDGADLNHIDADLYGPGCGPGEAVGTLVWQALRSRPILLTDDQPALIRPLHVRDVARILARGGGQEPVPAYPLEVFAHAVARAVRPVPVRDLRRGRARAAAPRVVDTELGFRLHHYAQWLAYEWRGGVAPVTRTSAGEPSAR